MNRTAEIKRKTKETDIRIRINLDGSGECDINTGIGFLDHMLSTLSKHSQIDLQISAHGDLHVDDHHTTEDVGICLGLAMKKALGEKAGIHRFGWAFCPMDESLARVVLDLSGRPVHQFASVEPYGLPLAEDSLMEFFRAWASNCEANLHMDLLRGINRHHEWEALFKAFALALGQAVTISSTGGEIPSTKGTL